MDSPDRRSRRKSLFLESLFIPETENQPISQRRRRSIRHVQFQLKGDTTTGSPGESKPRRESEEDRSGSGDERHDEDEYDDDDDDDDDDYTSEEEENGEAGAARRRSGLVSRRRSLKEREDDEGWMRWSVDERVIIRALTDGRDPRIGHGTDRNGGRSRHGSGKHRKSRAKGGGRRPSPSPSPSRHYYHHHHRRRGEEDGKGKKDHHHKEGEGEGESDDPWSAHALPALYVTRAAIHSLGHERTIYAIRHGICLALIFLLQYLAESSFPDAFPFKTVPFSVTGTLNVGKDYIENNSIFFSSIPFRSPLFAVFPSDPILDSLILPFSPPLLQYLRCSLLAPLSVILSFVSRVSFQALR